MSKYPTKVVSSVFLILGGILANQANAAVFLNYIYDPDTISTVLTIEGSIDTNDIGQYVSPPFSEQALGAFVSSGTTISAIGNPSELIDFEVVHFGSSLISPSMTDTIFPLAFSGTIEATNIVINEDPFYWQSYYSEGRAQGATLGAPVGSFWGLPLLTYDSILTFEGSTLADFGGYDGLTGSLTGIGTEIHVSFSDLGTIPEPSSAALALGVVSLCCVSSLRRRGGI